MKDNRHLGFFSGFPDHSFPDKIAERLGQEIILRDNLVFVSAWPQDHKRNDSDSTGMHGMFEKCGLPFAKHYVIDTRTDNNIAKQFIHDASCIFLMGGYPKLQMQLIKEKELDSIICNTSTTILGVSAGAINMAKHSLDTKESIFPYKGLGLADITIKPHFNIDDQQELSTLLQVSNEIPIYATEDDSAIFVAGEHLTYIGNIYIINNGDIVSKIVN